MSAEFFAGVAPSTMKFAPGSVWNTAASEGSLIELWHDTRFLADGDEVVLRGRTASLELGEVRGRVIPPSYGR